ncbi:MAG: DUF1266 domain-containing protein [Ketobacter sp.]|uniref:DUF1266 domain-containing protein n=1 Tax=Ketobacter sp. MCCC 1A13808 TaxID=2602738 RepID=UPI0018DE1C46|nr:DUF1266 domain-containing protein [Ketobacter sp. MCCC 1A13808]
MTRQDTDYNPQGHTDEQLWALALSAIITQKNGACHDRLSYGDPQLYNKLLQSWWDISDADSYRESVAWLRTDGHRVIYNDIYCRLSVTTYPEWQQRHQWLEKNDAGQALRESLVWHYRFILGNQSIIAWDLGRVILLARMAVTCGHITEQEAWDTILADAKEAKKLFCNWYQFAHSYLIGRQFAMKNLDDAQGEEHLLAAHHLLTHPQSPWLRHPFRSPSLSENETIPTNVAH